MYNEKELNQLLQSDFNNGYSLEKVYTYKNSQFEFTFWVARLTKPDEKKIFKPFHLQGSRIQMKLPDKYGRDNSCPLYGLDKLISNPNATVLIVEGEKCVDFINANFDNEKFIAVSSQGGSNSPQKADWKVLKDRNAIIWADNDEPGQGYLAKVLVRISGTTNKIRFVDVVSLNLPEKADCFDWGQGLENLQEEFEKINLINLSDYEKLSDLLPKTHSDVKFLLKKFPIDYLPNIIKESVEQYVDYAQVPVEMAVNCALAASAIACQGIANIRIDKNLCHPLSLYCLTIASSGERKTTCNNFFLKAIIEQDKEDSFEGHLYHESITTEALLDRLDKKLKYTSLISDEAGLVFGSHNFKSEEVMKTFSVFNKIWSSGSAKYETKGCGSNNIADVRLTLNLMMQEQILELLNENNKNLPKNIGLFARCLMVKPESKIGLRTYRKPKSNNSDKFYKRLKELFKFWSYKDSLPELKLSSDAMSIWENYHNGIETQLLIPDIDLSIYGDLTSKTAEIAARLAGIFHLINGNNTNQPVSGSDMESATKIALWYLQENIRIISNATLFNNKKSDNLLKWLQRNGKLLVKFRDIQNGNRSIVTNNKDILKVIKPLEDKQYIFTHANQVVVNPCLLI